MLCCSLCGNNIGFCLDYLIHDNLWSSRFICFQSNTLQRAQTLEHQCFLLVVLLLCPLQCDFEKEINRQKSTCQTTERLSELPVWPTTYCMFECGEGMEYIYTNLNNLLTRDHQGIYTV